MHTPSGTFENPPAVPAAKAATAVADQSAALRRWFGVDLAIVDARRGEVVRLPAGHPGGDWSARLRLAAEAVAGRQALLQERGPLACVALPLWDAAAPGLVALGILPTRECPADDELCAAADAWGLALDETRRWLASCPAMPADAWQRLARLVTALFQADGRSAQLEDEVAKLSANLSSTYEEITLVYRLSQNLRLTRQSSELSRLAVDSLLEIVGAEALVVQPAGQRDDAADDVAMREPEEPIVGGCCPLDRYELAQLVDYLELRPDGPPAVINHAAARRADWPFPNVESAIVCAIGDGGHHCGWLAAFNREDGKEFGSVEADLLRSIAGILGIHGGNTELYRKQAELLSGIVRALTSAIDAKDPYTCGHSDRVARVSVRLAEELGCSPEVVETIYLAGLLHDVGKIGIDDNVLRKPGKLTDAEYEHIKTHARIGYNILVDLKQLGAVLPVVLHHHENWDGRGYPGGLAGEKIPFLARIVAVADAFDAMGSDRPYRRGMDDERLDSIIRDGAGRQWDAQVVDAFFRARDDIRAIAKGDASEAERETVAFS